MNKKRKTSYFRSSEQSLRRKLEYERLPSYIDDRYLQRGKSFASLGTFFFIASSSIVTYGLL